MTTLQLVANAKRLGARDEIRALRRQAEEARERRDAYRARLEVLKQAKLNLIESAKRFGVDLQTYAAQYYAGQNRAGFRCEEGSAL